jgi:hypothetical protein
VSRNLFRKCVDCLEAGGQHFLISVWSKVRWTAGERLTVSFHAIKPTWQLLYSGTWFKLLISIESNVMKLYFLLWQNTIHLFTETVVNIFSALIYIHQHALNRIIYFVYILQPLYMFQQ